MAWYEINYACGHTGREQIYGPERRRQPQADAMERRQCADCYREQRNKFNVENAAKAAEGALTIRQVTAVNALIHYVAKRIKEERAKLLGDALIAKN